MKKSLVPLLALVLLGAGCASTTPSNLSTKPAPEVGSQQSATDNSPTIVVEGSASGSVTAEAEPVADTSSALKVDLRSGNFFFEPKTITATAGQQVEITFDENEGFHTFVIDAINFKQPVKADGTVSFIAPATAGNYPIYCDVGSHRAKGMEALLVVK